MTNKKVMFTVYTATAPSTQPETESVWIHVRYMFKTSQFITFKTFKTFKCQNRVCTRILEGRGGVGDG